MLSRLRPLHGLRHHVLLHSQAAPQDEVRNADQRRVAAGDDAPVATVRGELDAFLEGRSALKEEVYDLVVQKL